MIGQAEAIAPGERIELPHRQCDQHDEGQHDQDEGLVLHDVLGGMSLIFARQRTCRRKVASTIWPIQLSGCLYPHDFRVTGEVMKPSFGRSSMQISRSGCRCGPVTTPSTSARCPRRSRARPGRVSSIPAEPVHALVAEQDGAAARPHPLPLPSRDGDDRAELLPRRPVHQPAARAARASAGC